MITLKHPQKEKTLNHPTSCGSSGGSVGVGWGVPVGTKKGRTRATMFLALDKQKQRRRFALLPDYTRRTGFDTIRLNWDIGTDLTVYRLPDEHAWYGEKPLPPPHRANPLQFDFQLKCVEVEAYGGGRLNLKNGDRALWRREDGVYYELRKGRYETTLSLETSLPKLLFGHNRYPVSPELLPDAFAELDLRARAFIGPDLPPVHELDAWRIDATCDYGLRSELEVGLVSRVLADQSLNGFLATRYPTGGSLFWGAGQGLPGARCYGKFAESGNEKAVGTYRSEVQCMGGKQFRKVLAFAVANGDLRPELAAGQGRRCVRGEVLASEKSLCTGLLGALPGLVEKSIELAREGNVMTSLQAIDLLKSKAGVTHARAVHLVGYSHLIRVLGWSFTGLGRKGVKEAQKSFELAGVDPVLIEFGAAEKIGAGAGMVVGGAIAGGLFIGGAVAGNAIAEALLPDKPQAVSGSDAEKPVETIKAA